jgi:hypothetical protein
VIFKCGPSLMMRLERRYRRRREWHRWFAWRPARIQEGVCVWLEYVERKNTGPSCEGGWDEWEYRLEGK